MLVCVPGLESRLRPAIAGWVGGLCASLCALRLYLANPGWGSWCVSVGSGLCFHPPKPGWGVRGCVFLSAHSACSPPFAVSVCVRGCGCWLCPAIPGSGLQVGVYLCSPPLHPANPGCGVLGCVSVCALCLYSAIHGLGVRSGCVSLDLGFSCAPPFLAGVFLCVCLSARAACTPLVMARVGGACVWARAPAFTPPILAGVLRRVCLIAHFACTSPVLAGIALWVCVLGCWFRLRRAIPGWGVGAGVFLRLPYLYPAIPGWGVRACVSVCELCLYLASTGSDVLPRCVCLDLGFGCAPPFLTGLLGRVCRCARSAYTPPILAGVCCVFEWVRILGFQPAISGWHLGACVVVCALRRHLPSPDWALHCGCVYLGAGFGCAPPFLAGLPGCVCFCGCHPLLPSQSCLGCAV